MRLTLFFTVALMSFLAHGADRITGESFATRSAVMATNGMAATSQPLATQVALDVLKSGGNAIDAAIAANAMLGLVEPTGNGIGGDLFAIVWDAKSQKLYGLNASGRSPKSLTRQWFIDNGHDSIPPHGPLPVSVPGTVDGWFMLHERFGSKPMAELLQPTIDYAKNGFPVTDLIAYYWNRSVPILSKWPGFSEQFTNNGKAPAAGEIWKTPIWPPPWKRSLKVDAMLFTKVTLPAPSTLICRPTVAFSAMKTWPATPATGLSR